VAQGIAQFVAVIATLGGILQRGSQLGDRLWIEVVGDRRAIEGHHARRDYSFGIEFDVVNVRRNSADVKPLGAPLAAFQIIMVLILSADAVAAALLGALIETLGHGVRFARASETAEQTLRRVRPTVCLLNCEDPEHCSDEFIGRAAMRGISIVVFGTRNALERVWGRGLAAEHDVDMLVVPPDVTTVEETLKRAMKKAG